MNDTLICFDLDGTLSKQEILPEIAAVVGITNEIAALTQATIQGVISFDMSFKLRVRLLRDVNPATISAHLAETIEINECIVQYMRDRDDADYAIVTGNLDCWIRDLVDPLGVPCFSSVADVKDGRLNGVKYLMRKDEPVAALRRSYRRIIAVGDGENDIALFRHADVKIAFGGVHEPSLNLMNHADYIVYSSRSLCKLLSMQ
ncbi:haloacid dehalogenase [Burkholderia sp. ABCPW 14]|uniref:HAD-IB family phosphatase n=1 Tax=Burkholderia sp. ABCPW 14 TaxID=1637860 RepID=UPI000770C9D2|nr:HAD family phosphatase [Burkholderia sp. ABCPW 14]KVD84382.1 haloacid dehalogenase [Burkholderia sp. ABCPW 14]